MKTPSFVRITLRASKLQVRYREHVITNSYGELFQQANPRWERGFVRFLELSGVGRTMADGTDEDGARCHEDRRVGGMGIGGEHSPAGRRLNCCFSFSHIPFVRGYSCLRDLRTAHSGGRRISFVVADRPRAAAGFS